VRSRSGCLPNRRHRCWHGTIIPQSPSADCGIPPWRRMSFCPEAVGSKRFLPRTASLSEQSRPRIQRGWGDPSRLADARIATRGVASTSVLLDVSHAPEDHVFFNRRGRGRLSRTAMRRPLLSQLGQATNVVEIDGRHPPVVIVMAGVDVSP
jgi:hypothetical protein